MLSNFCVVAVVVYLALDEVVDLLVQLLDVKALAVLLLFSRVEVVHFCLVDVNSAFFHVDVAFCLVHVPFGLVDAVLDATIPSNWIVGALAVDLLDVIAVRFFTSFERCWEVVSL